jgi:hypothetical protein
MVFERDERLLLLEEKASIVAAWEGQLTRVMRAVVIPAKPLHIEPRYA